MEFVVTSRVDSPYANGVGHNEILERSPVPDSVRHRDQQVFAADVARWGPA